MPVQEASSLSDQSLDTIPHVFSYERPGGQQHHRRGHRSELGDAALDAGEACHEIYAAEPRSPTLRHGFQHCRCNLPDNRAAHAYGGGQRPQIWASFRPALVPTTTIISKCPFPAEWLSTPDEPTLVEASVDKLWIAPTDHVQLGYLLSDAGFLHGSVVR